jgi:hypothetical protein
MNTKLLLMSLFILTSSIAALAVMPTILSSQPVLAVGGDKDSPSDDNQGKGNDPPNNKNHRGNN